jgi:hypothetical protein
VVVLELQLRDVLAGGMAFGVEAAAERGVHGHPLELDAQELAGRVARILHLVDLLDGAGQPDGARDGGGTPDDAVAQADVLEEDGAAVTQVDERGRDLRMIVGGESGVRLVPHVNHAHPLVLEVQAIAAGKDLQRILGQGRGRRPEDEHGE